jgi:cell division transport system permease protein
LLPILVAAMGFLAALALAGFVAAGALGAHWRQGAEATLTVQVPQPEALAPPLLPSGGQPDPTAPLPASRRIDRALAVLRATAGIKDARVLSADQLAALLRPWLGTALAGMSLPMPAVIDVRLADTPPEMTSLAAQLDAAAPGTLTESHGSWAHRLTVLARSLQACSGAVLLVVALVAAAVVGVVTRAGVIARRDSIEIVHGLGATDSYIAAPFAWRAMMSAGLGGLAGALAALPVLLWLADLAAPFVGGQSFAFPSSGLTNLALPRSLWLGLPALPVAAASIGWLTAQIAVRRWVRRLP